MPLGLATLDRQNLVFGAGLAESILSFVDTLTATTVRVLQSRQGGTVLLPYEEQQHLSASEWYSLLNVKVLEVCET